MAVEKNKLEEEACVLRFFKIVLTWDYYRLLEEAQKRNRGHKKGDASASGLKEVKNTYKDVDEYLDTFEPLLFEEVKAQICQQKDEEEERVSQEAMVAECSEVNGFHLPVVICSDPDKVSQNDLLLVSDKKFGEGKLPKAYAFALVESRQQDKMRLRLCLGGEVKRFNTDEIQSCPRLLNMLPVVSEVQKIFFVEKICSLSTIVREYVAMRSISSLPFKDLILKAADNDDITEDRAWKLSKPLKQYIESNHNKSQLEAIYAGLSRKSFVLIQGPPGTGKTQTILGLLSAIVHATPPRVHSNEGKVVGVKRGPELSIQEKYIHWEKASPWLSGINPRDTVMPRDGDDGFFPTSGNDIKPEVVNSNRKYRVRVLVCAPSNSALDEIVLRILNTGIRDENDHAYNPKIVRIGLKPHHSVQAVSMDYLVEQKLAGMGTQVGDKKQGGTAKDRDNIRASILDEAVIVFSTLSFSGSTLFNKLNRGFDVVIIDEAAQAVEPATLVPLASGCKQVFLVGDPVQLPATVISTVANKYGYGMSLFKRFQRAGYPVQMLKTQYRMHPEIRSFPSREFYEDALVDGPDVADRIKPPWHDFRCFGPFCFFDIQDGKESQPQGSGSWVNVDEVDFVMAMYSKLISSYPELKSSSRLAIISPYRYQVSLLREKFHSTFGVESAKLVDINTVDGFQGREKEVAIFSCVRANKDRGIGFVADFRRMNVGITRARSSVLVVGSASTLRGDGHWKNLIESAEHRDVLFKVSKPYTEFFSKSSFESMKVEVAAAESPFAEMDVDVDMAVNAAAVESEDNFGEDDDEDFGED